MNSLTKDIQNNLCSLNRKSLVLFMISCAERLLPNYTRFSIDYNFGYPLRLRSGLDFVWSWVENEEIEEAVIVYYKDAVEKIIPDTEDFPSALCSYALNSSAAVFQTLCAIQNKDLSLCMAKEVSTLSSDTVDQYIQLKELYPPYHSAISDVFENSIVCHPLMQLELNRQWADIDLLMHIDIDRNSILNLYKIWSCIRTSNIEIDY